MYFCVVYQKRFSDRMQLKKHNSWREKGKKCLNLTSWVLQYIKFLHSIVVCPHRENNGPLWSSPWLCNRPAIIPLGARISMFTPLWNGSLLGYCFIKYNNCQLISIKISNLWNAVIKNSTCTLFLTGYEFWVPIHGQFCI